MEKYDGIKAVALAAATMVAEMLGGGIVSLPKSIVDTGIYPGAIMLLFGAVWTYYTGKCLSAIYIDMQSRKNVINNNNNTGVLLLDIDNAHSIQAISNSDDSSNDETVVCDTPYMEMSRIVFGKIGEYLMCFCLVITLIFVDIIFLILCGKNVSGLLNGLLNDDSKYTSQTACILYFAIGTLIASFFWGKVSHYEMCVNTYIYNISQKRLSEL